MTENENKIVELHKHIVSSINLIREIYGSTNEDFLHACVDEHLVVNLLPLVQNAVEEMLELNEIYCINNIIKGEVVSDYFEKAEFDPNTKKEDKKVKG